MPSSLKLLNNALLIEDNELAINNACCCEVVDCEAGTFGTCFSFKDWQVQLEGMTNLGFPCLNCPAYNQFYLGTFGAASTHLSPFGCCVADFTEFAPKCILPFDADGLYVALRNEAILSFVYVALQIESSPTINPAIRQWMAWGATGDAAKAFQKDLCNGETVTLPYAGRGSPGLSPQPLSCEGLAGTLLPGNGFCIPGTCHLTIS